MKIQTYLTTNSNAMRMTNASPYRLADLHRKLPPFQFLINQPKSYYKLLTTEGRGFVRSNEIVDLFQDMT